MEVQVSLYGMYRQYLPSDAPSASSFAVELSERATVATLAERLGIPREKVRQVFVSGIPSGLEAGLRPGAKVVFVPPSAGGENPARLWRQGTTRHGTASKSLLECC